MIEESTYVNWSSVQTLQQQIAQLKDLHGLGDGPFQVTNAWDSSSDDDETEALIMDQFDGALPDGGALMLGNLPGVWLRAALFDPID